jgi:excisionase family DNA binding protein
MFSLSQAAKHAGVSKATIHRAIKSGRLSALRQDDGSYQIDEAELHRVYELTVTGETAEGGSAETIRNPEQPPPETTAVLEAELTGARALVRLLEVQVEDLRRDRDGWRTQAEASQRLLTPPPSSATTVRPRPWWKRLVG